ncbi:MAG: undecaprenyldiphospho-muramoylpentapeptide beta-N-acetylglucosaminyltransferase [Sandaracinaceae bacterium]|nr:undecaprenyldiphospho-muramoylpentapeptide beta-N-acetylglucosaminyltransferase [Sandaracinaceae bacterium]
MIQKIIVAGGGTGGHLFPGVAIVEELRRRTPGIDPVFVGTRRGIEARVIPAMGETLELIDVAPLKGLRAKQIAESLALLPKAMSQAVSIVRRVRPQLVLGVGGYASGPVLAAAAAMRIPTALLEPNAHIGLTNKLLSNMVGRAYVAHQHMLRSFGEKRARLLGTPVRRAFVDASRLAQMDPEGFEARARRVLVLGGSQGARSLNVLVPEALAKSHVAERGIEIVHQAGAAMVAEVQARYAQLGVSATVVPFIEDMARAYSSSSVVISRAGAATVAELSAIGRAAILIPFPQATDDHQTKNAEALMQEGAALMMKESAFSVDELAYQVQELVADPYRRAQMAMAARRVGHPEAAAAIVDDLCAWLGCAASGASDNTDGSASGSRSGRTSEPPLSSRPRSVPPPAGFARAKEATRRRNPRVRGGRFPSVRPLPIASNG